jgi:hypothetical protein
MMDIDVEAMLDAPYQEKKVNESKRLQKEKSKLIL